MFAERHTKKSLIAHSLIEETKRKMFQSFDAPPIPLAERPFHGLTNSLHSYKDLGNANLSYRYKLPIRYTPLEEKLRTMNTELPDFSLIPNPFIVSSS